MIELDIQQYHTSIDFRIKGGKRYLFDPIRKKELVVQPEELVRQTWMHYLKEEHDISFASLSVEKMVTVGEMSKRFDLIMNKKGKPYVLFEFKSFKINITENTCRQVASYNLGLSVPYVVISNGIIHYAYKIDHKEKSIIAMSDFDFVSAL
ncbi:type I restriction enzyme HsdR N-terminal domain-containing protein [Saprospiraceae bacterium]|nr:type I restriction enzyme HsdR N-terminal domain-containing protein [Saprospiraceae bacterium]